jgi:hypothetical protein
MTGGVIRARRRGPGRALLAPAAAGVLLCAALAAPPTAFDPTQSDPRAIVIADLVLKALGGREAWEGTRFIHFAFEVEKGGRRLAYRTHLWDRWQGRLRYETAGKDGHPVVALLDVGTRRGEAYRDGARVADADARPDLDEAYEAWINDTYWLLMPYKMKDPGVRLQYAGTVKEKGKAYERVLLTFDGVGLTPKDRYWAHVDPATHLMDRWSYILQDDPPGSRPEVWEWRDWRRYGRILLSPEKVKVSEGTGEAVRIRHPILAVYDALPDGYFTRPDPLPEPLVP